MDVDPNAAWSPWVDFLAEVGPLGAAVQDVAVAPLPDGRLELWATLGDGGLWVTSKVDADPNAAWSAWVDFLVEVGPLPALPQQVAVAPLSDGRLELWAVDGNGGLQTTWKVDVDPNGNWAPWVDFLAEVGPLASGARQVAVTMLFNARSELWAVDGNGKLWVTWKVDANSNAAWSPWSDFLEESNEDAARCGAAVLWENYGRTQAITPEATCTPESVGGISALVQAAEAAGKRVHAFGSRWSFSGCAVTADYSINTRNLNRELRTVQRALLPDKFAPPYQPYHVEAGITIRDLYNNLHNQGLALETMGGSSGQTLAGAISTGTHGGDKLMPPLADSVLAIHLVGAGGTQYWIEPSAGITDRALLEALVVPDIQPQNIIYDDAIFNACLVSLGCMGIIYAVVLRVRAAYDLVETTGATTWEAFKLSAFANLTQDPVNRFLQVVLNPYKDGNGSNLCHITTRYEDAAPTKPMEDRENEDGYAALDILKMLGTIAALLITNPTKWWLITVLYRVWNDRNLPESQKIVNIVNIILHEAPFLRYVLTDYYKYGLQDRIPVGNFRGLSFSVMDRNYSKPHQSSDPGYSMELHFPALDVNGRLGSADFVDAVISAINDAKDTFLVGYIALRFTGRTRAFLGMQQWNQTCTVEIAGAQGVDGLEALLIQIYEKGIELGGLPHWGQIVDWGTVQGDASLYPQYAEWRQVYGRMSNNFTTRTFENDSSTRWKLTTPPPP